MDEEAGAEPATTAKKDLMTHECSRDPRYKSEFQSITKIYSSFRRCIRDGNCLYTSYAIGLADLVGSGGDALFRRLVDVFRDINSRFHAYGVEELGYSGFHESFVSILGDAAAGSRRPEDIPLYSWYDCVAYLRLVVSCEIKSNPERYQPHIPDMDVSRYCTMFVDPFYKEAGYVEICALSNSIPVSICIVDLHRSTNNVDVYGDHPAELSIFYTHNHFEPIYR